MTQHVSKAVILAGGFGTRLSEATEVRPKPLVEIGGLPILWHIMKIYYAHGIREFVICLGYKGYMIKEFFSNYYIHVSDYTIDFSDNSTTFHNKRAEDWKVTLVDTGLNTMSGGRIKRIAPYVGDQPFCMTYGDGVGDVDIKALIAQHLASDFVATMTVVTPPGRFGAAKLDGNKITEFREKPMGDGNVINGGFFVLSPGVFDFIDGDETAWELDPLQRMSEAGCLGAYSHTGFWKPMDTLRDVVELQKLWDSAAPPWRVWE
jgi:glucose-1-phosphate cytidylyltransferase